MQREHNESLIFYPINDNFGCFIEYNDTNSPTFVSLVEYDFIDKIFRKIQTFELNGSWNKRIFVDESDSSKFILIWKKRNTLHIQRFRLLNGTVKLENTAQYKGCTFSIDHYFNGCVYEGFYVSWIYINLIIYVIVMYSRLRFGYKYFNPH
jgi:hypothetical protein